MRAGREFLLTCKRSVCVCVRLRRGCGVDRTRARASAHFKSKRKRIISHSRSNLALVWCFPFRKAANAQNIQIVCIIHFADFNGKLRHRSFHSFSHSLSVFLSVSFVDSCTRFPYLSAPVFTLTGTSGKSEFKRTTWTMGNETKHRKYNENQMQTELKPKSRLKQSSVCFFHSFVCPIRRFSVRLCVCQNRSNRISSLWQIIRIEWFQIRQKIFICECNERH